MKKSDIHKIIQEEIHEHMIEESITSWLLDKAETFVTNALNHKADYQYARILSSPDFKALGKKWGMNEKEFQSKAAAMIKKDPAKFSKLLAYDIHKSPWAKYYE
jgi:hypothetical protein